MSAKAQMKLAVPTLIEPTREYREYRKMLITPAQSKLWLEKFNQKNRPVSTLKVTQFGVDMIEGRWLYSHAPILFDPNGQLIDGQHRLYACVESESPFVADVYFGEDPGLRSVVDIGTTRTLAHQIQIEELGSETPKPNPKERAAIASMLAVAVRHGESKVFDPNFNCSKPAVLADMKANRFTRLDDAAKVAKAMGRRCRGSIAGFCWYLFSGQSRELADRFFDELRTGLNLSDNSSVYWLRRRLEANREAKAKLPPQQIYVLFRKAWIFYRDGRACGNLRWRTDGPTPEKFPDIGPVEY